jgi:acetyl esterase/lipase
MQRPPIISVLPLIAALAVSCAPVKPARSQELPPIAPAPPSATNAGVRIWRDIAYVSKGHERQKLDFYAPSPESGGAGPWPIVLYIHGGGWAVGNKSGNAAMGLCWQGYAVASIGYRLSSHAPFPAQIETAKPPYVT